MYYVILVFLFLNNLLHAFSTLKQVTQYAEKNPQDTAWYSNEDVADPDYTQWYKQKIRNQFFDKIISMKTTSLWSAQHLKDNLINTIQQQEQYNYSGNYILKSNPAPGSQYIVWGSLNGAFHSLARALVYLHKHNYIDNNLKIINPNCYFIFNGNAIGSSAFVLEAFTLILTLMNNNPQRVFYIKGINEKSVLQSNVFKRALQAQAYTVSKEKIPLSRLVNRFFNTLPLAFYIGGARPEDGLIRISYYAADSQKINELFCGHTLSNLKINTIVSCKLTNLKRPYAPTVEAIVKSDDKMRSYQFRPGLTLLEPDKGATAWALFSGLTLTYSTYFDFVHDTFIIIKTGLSINDTTISLYSRDSRGNKKIKCTAIYNIISGKQIHTEQKLKQTKAPSVDQNLSHSLPDQVKQIQETINKLSQDLLELQRSTVKNVVSKEKTTGDSK